MQKNRRSFILNISALIIFPYLFLSRKNQSIKIINGWILKSEDFK